MHSEGQPACPICFCSFQTFNQRTNHMRKIHERGLTKCEICNIDFHSKYYLIKHNKKEHIAVVNRECPECKKVLKTEYTYERHMKAHTDEKLFQCKHCGKGFMQPRNMRIHEAKHTGPVERSFLCDMCGECKFRMSRIFFVYVFLSICKCTNSEFENLWRGDSLPYL